MWVKEDLHRPTVKLIIPIVSILVKFRYLWVKPNRCNVLTGWAISLPVTVRIGRQVELDNRNGQAIDIADGSLTIIMEAPEGILCQMIFRVVITRQ